MDNASPPPPIFQVPPLHSPKNSNFPVIAIAVIGILATAFLLISYYIFVIKCCLTWHRVDVFNRFFSRVRDPSDEDSRFPSPSNPPYNLEADNKGLDEALIRSIPLIEFRKLKQERKLYDAKTMPETYTAYECAVCLSEFDEGEKLRVIPNCCHAFHIDCIDIWLQSNANCPLCRSGISPSSILYSNIWNNNNNDDNNTRQNAVGVNPQRKDVGHDTDGSDSDDYVVIEIQGNNLDEPRLVTRESEDKKRRLRHVWSVGDEMIDVRKIDEEFKNVQSIRRSVSMDLSSHRQFCFEIQQCCGRSRSISSSSTSNNIVQENEVSGSSGNYSKVRRSIFSFGYGRSSRCSVQPVHLDP